MNQVLLFLAVIFALAGCASRRSPAKQTAAANMFYVHGVAPDADNSQQWMPLAFQVGTQRFGSLEDFKAFVAGLRPGSVVYWSSGCLRYKVIPLAHSQMSIEDFKAYCSQHGVEFQYHFSVY